jgi:hypothetical protein
MLYNNLITASCVIFTNKYLKPPGALGKMPTMLILQTVKDQEISIG